MNTARLKCIHTDKTVQPKMNDTAMRTSVFRNRSRPKRRQYKANVESLIRVILRTYRILLTKYACAHALAKPGGTAQTCRPNPYLPSVMYHGINIILSMCEQKFEGRRNLLQQTLLNVRQLLQTYTLHQHRHLQQREQSKGSRRYQSDGNQPIVPPESILCEPSA